MKKLRCCRCGEEKPVSEFGKNPHRKRGYCYRCKKCAALAQKQSILDHPEKAEKRKEDWKEYSRTHKVERAEWYQNNRERILSQQKEYEQSHREERREWGKQYRQTERGKELIRGNLARYRRSEKGKLAMAKHDARYRQTEKGKLKEKRHQHKRRRSLGFNPLNKSFSGSVWHHINDQDVVAIAEVVHLKFGGGHDRIHHRRKIWQYYGRSIENMIAGVSVGMIEAQQRLL
jgi:hypothetical protein